MRKIIAFSMAAALAAASLAACNPAKTPSDKLTPVTLNEVAHSIFYAPQYAAIELGYFEEEGIDLTLVNGGGADKVMTALIETAPLRKIFHFVLHFHIIIYPYFSGSEYVQPHTFVI